MKSSAQASVVNVDSQPSLNDRILQCSIDGILQCVVTDDFYSSSFVSLGVQGCCINLALAFQRSVIRINLKHICLHYESS